MQMHLHRYLPTSYGQHHNKYSSVARYLKGIVMCRWSVAYLATFLPRVNNIPSVYVPGSFSTLHPSWEFPFHSFLNLSGLGFPPEVTVASMS